MPQPIDVGSILGGRYKVTGRILASAENDIILDGLDQVLNRPVSILVSAVENSQHLTQSARDVATGARVSNVSILDLGVQDKATYLIAARTSSADLLDLVVPTDPAEEVYQEPFFTDTLGTEIFGQARDAAPAGGAYVYEDNSPLTPAKSVPKVSREETRHDAASVPTPPPAAAVAPAVKPAAAVVPPTAAQQTPAAAKVTLWDEDDYGFINEEHQEDLAESRRPGTFPAELRDAGDGYTEDDTLDEEDDGNAPRTSGRWLTGAIVSVLLIGALIFAFQHIGTLFNGSSNQAGTTTSAATPGESAKQSSDAPAEPKPVAPVVTGLTDITAYAPGVQNYGETYFPRLKEALDSNKATYWPTVEFSGADFGGMTDSIDLVVELAEESTIGSVTINQLAGSGGQFDILTNDKPVLEGATKIGSGSFSAPDFTFTAPPGIKAKYVIISFTELPKLQPFVTYPYGLKITEISVK
ncbi:MAG: ABC transporter substrate-binding protein [Specibacter sp.]